MTVRVRSARLSWVANACLTLCPLGAMAQQAPAAAASAPKTVLEAVTVNGTKEADDRRDATAAKTVISRETITRYGDTNLADVLRRVPGITVTKSRGDGSTIRMRGLGEGYTQLMINGEPALPGVTLDSISPDLIERIEVIRTATADQSTQAIAGTINVILRRSAKRRDHGMKVGLSTKEGLVSGQASTEYGEQNDTGSWSLAANVGVNRDRWSSTTEQIGRDAADTLLYRRITNTDDTLTKSTAGITANSLWKWGEGDSVNLNGFVQAQHSRLQETEVRYATFGTPSEFAGDSLHLPSHSLLARLTGALKLNWDDAGQLDQRVTTALTDVDADGLRAFYDDPAQHIVDRRVVGHLKDTTGTWTGKYSKAFRENQVIDAGWDGQLTQRNEQRTQTETSPVGHATESFDQRYEARVTRLALYVQDEISLGKGLALYGGVRWEGLHTKVTGNDNTDIAQRSSVFSPTMQLLWKIPDSKSDQLRLSLGRTYRAPATKDLIPRRWQTADNSPTTSDFQGNPALRPELAWALDLGYEHYLSGGGLLSVNVYTKRIQGVILQQLFQAADGHWVTSPYNGGDASASGVEFEGKAKLKDLLGNAPDADVRLSVGRNWSRVDSLPGPGNRLSQQAPLTISTGVDYRPTTDFTVGLGYTYSQGAYTQSSLTRSTTTHDSHSADLYGLWKVAKDLQVHASVSVTPGPDDGLRDGYADANGSVQQVVRSARQWTAKIQVQKTF